MLPKSTGPGWILFGLIPEDFCLCFYWSTRNMLAHMPFLNCKINTFYDEKVPLAFTTAVHWINFWTPIPIMAILSQKGLHGHYGHGHIQVWHDMIGIPLTSVKLIQWWRDHAKGTFPSKVMCDFVNWFEIVLILQYKNFMLAQKLSKRFLVLQS